MGITAYEMAMGLPPHANIHPMRVLFLIPKDEPPQLPADRFSVQFRDFLHCCLVKKPSQVCFIYLIYLRFSSFAETPCQRFVASSIHPKCRKDGRIETSSFPISSMVFKCISRKKYPRCLAQSTGIARKIGKEGNFEKDGIGST